jgi:hypothetical protein
LRVARESATFPEARRPGTQAIRLCASGARGQGQQLSERSSRSGVDAAGHSRLELQIQAQPDDATCGPTCLQAVYAFYDDWLPLDQLIAEIANLETGGTLAVYLACHALRRGYRARVYTYNLEIFDPSWFRNPRTDLAAKLTQQARVKANQKLRVATRAYLEFLELGGELRFEELDAALIRHYLLNGRPVLCGLSATYLYDCAREREAEDGKLVPDDVEGFATGHFVVLSGYDPALRRVEVSDPYPDTPFASHYYSVGIDRVLGAILLGVLTYDANFLVLEPPSDAPELGGPGD